MPRYAKAKKFKRILSQTAKNSFEVKIRMNISFQLLLQIIKLKSQ